MEMTGPQRAQTGIPNLDDILGGGLPKNRLYLIQGDPGVGKTTLALQFLLEGVRQGEQVLYITLSETKDELEAVAASHGWSLDGVSLYELSAMEAYLEADAENTVFHPEEVELTETTNALMEQIERVQPSRVVFDSLSEMRLLAREALAYRRQILSLKQYFAGKNCTVLLLDDMTSGPGDLHLQSIAHGVILLDQNPAAFGIDRRRLRIQKLRGVPFRSGFHDLGMATGGLRVFPRLVAAEHRQSTDEGLISSGSQGLDDLLGGGIDRGVSTLLLGPAGSGKSTVATQYAVAAAERGQKATMYLFEESPRTLNKRCRALGIPLEKHLESGNIRIQFIDPAEMTPGEFTDVVRRDVENGEVTVVVIDSLNGFIHSMPEERFLLLQLHELLAYLGQKGISTFMVVAQHGMLGAGMNAPVDVSYLADTVLLFRLYELDGRLQQAVSVLKRRGGEHERGIHELRFGAPEGVQVGPALDYLQGVLTGVPTMLRAELQA